MAYREISTSEFKAHQAHYLAELAARQEPMVLTRRGKPIARLEPIEPEPGAPRNAFEALYGSMRGTVRIHGDLTEPLDVEWDALK